MKGLGEKKGEQQETGSAVVFTEHSLKPENLRYKIQSQFCGCRLTLGKIPKEYFGIVKPYALSTSKILLILCQCKSVEAIFQLVTVYAVNVSHQKVK